MKIYQDMDSCLTDFMGSVREVDPSMPNWAPDEQLWPVVKSIPNFWENMPWMPDGKKLWNYVKQFNVEILSAPTSHDVRCEPGKIQWLRKNLGPDVKYNFCKSSLKKFFAHKNAILIDDLKSNVDDWNQYGGIGIHHKNADDTIRQLKILGLGEID